MCSELHTFHIILAFYVLPFFFVLPVLYAFSLVTLVEY